MRLFLAIELSEEIRDHIIRLRDHVKSEISKAAFTNDENLHITLKFLGETDPDRLDEIAESLSRIRTERIEIAAETVQCFPDRGPIRIVAAEFGGDIAGVEALHHAIEQRCRHLGFDQETRKYRPHVTLARARPVLPQEIRSRLAASSASLLLGPGFPVEHFALIQSRLGPSGSIYQTLMRFSLVAG